VAGTIRENLMYGVIGSRTDDACWEALSQARLRDVVSGLPRGLAHVLPEDGSGLSAGQKQRLCLARALLAQPDVLILDEVSANLDDVTEREIADSLGGLRGRCTMIVVSHRKGILRHADRIVDLSQVAHEKQPSIPAFVAES
jgi:ATP-binding cassette subfamily B protein